MQKAGENRDIPWISKRMGLHEELSPPQKTEDVTKTGPSIQLLPIWEGRKLGDTSDKVSPVSIGSAFKKSIDLMHFGRNIGKAFGKKRIHTATFIKNVFAHSLRDIEVSTIERKMSHTESECRIKLDGHII